VTGYVTVRVLDSNDNEPVFERARYQLRLPEDLPVYTRVLTVRATDSDLTANDRLIYGLSAQSRHHLGHVTSSARSRVHRRQQDRRHVCHSATRP